VLSLVQTPLEGIWLGTFHAMCARLLRHESRHLPFKSNFVIFDEDDQASLVRLAIRELNLDDKQYQPPVYQNIISTAKNNLVLPADFPSSNYREEIARRIYAKYQDLLTANNAVDFDDLLLYACKLLREDHDIRQRYAQFFEHVLVDEFQDTNLAQYELLKLLSSVNRNLFVVGDEDQSIYRWRGADYRNVLRFEEDFAECTKILLEQNYRSTQTVLDAAQAIIDRNEHRTPKSLFTSRGRGEQIILYEAVDDHAEAAYVVDTIQQLIQAGSAKAANFAVMYRTNAQSRLLEEAFLRAGMAYRLVGAQRFYGRREVKDLIAYLRLVQNPADEISLARAISNPPRGIGEKTFEGLIQAARQASVSPADILLDLASKGDQSRFYDMFKGRGANLLGDFGSLLVGWLTSRERVQLPKLFDRIAADIKYENYINDGSEEGISRWENVQELRRIAYEYKEQGLTAFLENLALISDQDTLPEKVDSPTLLTLHSAKGLEFDHVFITGLDEGLLPHSRSRDDPEQMAEERRLFYVGITRAKNHLTLVRSKQRSTFGSYEYSTASRFLADIPESLIQEAGVRVAYGKPQKTIDLFARWNLPPMPGKKEEVKPVQPKVQKPACTCGTNPGARGWWWTCASRTTRSAWTCSSIRSASSACLPRWQSWRS